MSHKEIMEAYRSMQEQALEEKKLSKDQKKEMDVDNDNDIDGDDLKKLRSKKDDDDDENEVEDNSSKKKAKGKKDDEMEVRIESLSDQSVDYARERNSAATQAVLKMWAESLGMNEADQTKGATPPEKIDSKMSPKSKEFVDMHGKKIDSTVYPSQQTAVDAGRSTSRAPARPGDKR